MKYQYAFGDEAGGVGDKTGVGATVHFVAALLLTNAPDRIRDSVGRFRREKHIRDESEISFNSSPDANRMALLVELLREDFVVRAVVVDKRTLNKESRLRGLGFYVHFWTLMFKWIGFREFDRARVILDEYGGPATTVPELTRSIRSEIGIHVPGPHLAVQIRAVPSEADFGLTAVDMLAGSVLRIVEHGDTRFYQLIRSRAQIWRPLENENPPS